MSTRATAALIWLSQQWEATVDSATRRTDAATQAGIVGDAAHRKRGGYHISRQDNPAGNYSIIRADDRAGCGPDDAAAAIDMTYARTADLAATHERLRVVWRNRATHPAARYLNAWCGWDGHGSAGRYDLVTGKVSTATADHKWHIHLEVRRRYVNDMIAMRTILDAITGTNMEDTVSWETEITIPERHRKAIPDLTETMTAGVLLECAYANARVIAQKIEALAAAEQARDAETTAAVAGLRAALDTVTQAMNAGTGTVLDTAAILARVDERAAEIRALVETRHEAEVSALRAQLDALTQGAGGS